MAYKPHSQRTNAPRAKRVASSVPGSTALQAPAEYVSHRVTDDREMVTLLSMLHSDGYITAAILPAYQSPGYVVFSWRFVPSKRS